MAFDSLFKVPVKTKLVCSIQGEGPNFAMVQIIGKGSSKRIYICQNFLSGNDCGNKLGFRYSWAVATGTEEELAREGVIIFQMWKPTDKGYETAESEWLKRGIDDCMECYDLSPLNLSDSDGNTIIVNASTNITKITRMVRLLLSGSAYARWKDGSLESMDNHVPFDKLFRLCLGQGMDVNIYSLMSICSSMVNTNSTIDTSLREEDDMRIFIRARRVNENRFRVVPRNLLDSFHLTFAMWNEIDRKILS